MATTKAKRQQHDTPPMIPAFSGQIPVCIQCQSRQVRPHGIREGLWPGGGEGVAWYCESCGHIGQPLLIDPDDQGPSEKDEAWQEEYQATAKALQTGTGSERPKSRNARTWGILLLVVAALFFLPPLMLITNGILAGQGGLVREALAQTWLFLAVATVALVLGARKMEQAAKIDADPPKGTGPLAELEEQTKNDDQGRP